MVWEDSTEKKEQIECKYAWRGQRGRVVEAQESTSRAKQLERLRPGRMRPKQEKLLRSTSTAVWTNQRLRFLGGPPSAFRALPLPHPVLPPLRCGDRFSFPPPLSSFRSSSLLLLLVSPSLAARQTPSPTCCAYLNYGLPALRLRYVAIVEYLHLVSFATSESG